MTEALAQAKKARFEILDVIEATIPEVRPELAPTAPKIDTIKIDVDKIKIVIGKGGETIDKIIAETGVKIDIDEEGNVSIYSSDQDAINRAKEIIAGLVREAKVDEVYRAKVVRIEKFGAFVNLSFTNQTSNDFFGTVNSILVARVDRHISFFVDINLNACFGNNLVDGFPTFTDDNLNLVHINLDSINFRSSWSQFWTNFWNSCFNHIKDFQNALSWPGQEPQSRFSAVIP